MCPRAPCTGGAAQRALLRRRAGLVGRTCACARLRLRVTAATAIIDRPGNPRTCGRIQRLGLRRRAGIVRLAGYSIDLWRLRRACTGRSPRCPCTRGRRVTNTGIGTCAGLRTRPRSRAASRPRLGVTCAGTGRSERIGRRDRAARTACCRGCRVSTCITSTASNRCACYRTRRAVTDTAGCLRLPCSVVT